MVYYCFNSIAFISTLKGVRTSYNAVSLSLQGFSRSKAYFCGALTDLCLCLAAVLKISTHAPSAAFLEAVDLVSDLASQPNSGPGSCSVPSHPKSGVPERRRSLVVVSD